MVFGGPSSNFGPFFFNLISCNYDRRADADDAAGPAFVGRGAGVPELDTGREMWGSSGPELIVIAIRPGKTWPKINRFQVNWDDFTPRSGVKKPLGTC